MLFAVKRKAVWALPLALLLASVSLAARDGFNLSWSLAATPGAALQVALAVGVIGASDGLIHGLLWVAAPGWYGQGYRRLVAYFSPQGAPEIAAGGLLAGAEELLFRGVLLQAALERLGWTPAAAIAGTAVVFMLCHVLLQRTLLPFAIWALWEGILLGLIYVVSGSLLVVLLTHGLHDVGGFSLFALQRRRRAPGAEARFWQQKE